MAAQSTTTKGKSAGKAGGQRTFEDEMREAGTKSSASKKSDPEENLPDTSDNTESETNDGDNTGSDESTDMDTASDDQTNEVTGETESETGAEITASSVLAQAGINPENATEEQIGAAEDVIKSSEGTATTMDDLKKSLEGVLQQTAPDSMSDAQAQAKVDGDKTAAKGKIPNGQVTTQPNLLAAILQAKTIYTRFRFGKCERWFKIAKKEATQTAQTVQAFEKPAAHGMEYFATLEDDCLFMGEMGAR